MFNSFSVEIDFRRQNRTSKYVIQTYEVIPRVYSIVSIPTDKMCEN